MVWKIFGTFHGWFIAQPVSFLMDKGQDYPELETE